MTKINKNTINFLSLISCSFLFIQCKEKTDNKNYYQIEVENKFGYIDSTGKIIIPAQYLKTSGFSEGITWVAVDTVKVGSVKLFGNNGNYRPFSKIYKYGYINSKNEFIINPTLIYKVPLDENKRIYTHFKEGLAIYQNEKTLLYGYINQNGDTVIPAKFDTAEPFSDSLALVGINEKRNNIFGSLNQDFKFGFINHNGEFVINPKYDRANNFREGLSVGYFGWIDSSTQVARRECVVINKKGLVIGTPFGMTNISRFYEGFALENNLLNTVRFVNTNGEFATDHIEDAYPFSDGLAPVKVNGKWGFVNKKFKLIIPAIYDNAGMHSKGLFPVKKGRYWGYINNTGTTIIPFKFDTCGSFYSGYLAKYSMKQSGYNIDGYINKKGEVVWQTETFSHKK
jgi:hypothetical protein